jgi:hypothetical protein
MGGADWADVRPWGHVHRTTGAQGRGDGLVHQTDADARKGEKTPHPRPLLPRTARRHSGSRGEAESSVSSARRGPCLRLRGKEVDGGAIYVQMQDLMRWPCPDPRGPMRVAQGAVSSTHTLD